MEMLSGLERSILQILSNSTDECGEPGWIRLNEMLLMLDHSETGASEEQFEVSPGVVIDQVSRALEQAYADDLIEKFEEKAVSDTAFRISHHGSYVISGFEKFVIGAEKESAISVDSSYWTGLEARLVGERRIEFETQLEALRACVTQSELDERTKKNVSARLDAIKKLMDAPDPPWELVIELLNHKALTAFLNFSAILTILFGNL